MPNEPILKVENLNVQFDDSKIISDLSFEVNKGDIMAVIGPNGAGKTVLFRALLGLVPYTGEISWEPDVKIGYVPQKFSVERDLPLSIKEFLNFKDGRKNFTKALQAVGFKTNDSPPHSYMSGGGEHHLTHHILDLPVGVVSGGEFQKILIAFSLIDNPNVLLFDEPTAGIDVGSEENIYNLLHRLRDETGLTILFISHDIHFAYRYASSVLCINKEKICFGPSAEALTDEVLKRLYGSNFTLERYAEHQHRKI